MSEGKYSCSCSRCDGLSLHLSKFYSEVTAPAACGKIELLSGTPALSRLETQAVNRNQVQSEDKDAL